MMDFSIIPECYIDTNLVETIVPPAKKGYNHQKGCGTVTRLMQGKLKDKFAVGIVDKDKKELKYAGEFVEIGNTGDMQLLRHQKHDIHHYLIFLNPAVETWILNAAKSAGVSLKDFGLPVELKALTKRTKTVTSKNDVAFKKLFREMKKRDAKSTRILAEWITYLKQNSYQSDIDRLKEIAAK